jgi:hypothetical protein
MNEELASGFFDEYIETFYRCEAGLEDFRAMLSFYFVPFSFSSAQGFTFLPDEAAVLAFVGQMVERLRAAGFATAETLHREFVTLNRVSSHCIYYFLRKRGDGSELERMTVTYLLAETNAGVRIITFAADI